ncbi:hypothetical protein MKX01_014250, partial [Papaver californicum]
LHKVSFGKWKTCYENGGGESKLWWLFEITSSLSIDLHRLLKCSVILQAYEITCWSSKGFLRGALCPRNKLGYDVFDSEEEALNFITNGSKWLCKSVTYARAILGYSALGSFRLLLVATKFTASIPNLPGGGPFPSRMSLMKPDEEFVWNLWFSAPFKDIGLPQHCVVLLQGFAECRIFGSSGQQQGVVALTARRSKLHPGTRYLARGLNGCFSTGSGV